MFEPRTIQVVTQEESHPPVQPAAPKTLKAKLFSFSGRINRMTYLGLLCGYFVVVFLCYVFAFNMNDSVVGAIIILAVVFLCAWSMMAAFAKRLHDRNLSGWWQLLAIIPAIGYIMPIVLIFLAGTKGVNNYGQEP